MDTLERKLVLAALSEARRLLDLANSELGKLETALGEGVTPTTPGDGTTQPGPPAATAGEESPAGGIPATFPGSAGLITRR